jgi:hypothetical protein
MAGRYSPDLAPPTGRKLIQLGPLNGATPSEQLKGEDSIPIVLVYAVTEALRFLRERAPGDNSVRRLAWRSETAWSAVLAGDIDDIEEHIQQEEAAREP